MVLLLHGLGGDSQGRGLRRLAWTLRWHGFGVLRLNLRGAGEGRSLAPGTYAAACSRDLFPVVRYARQLSTELGGATSRLPLHGVGLSLGGTVLLNACLDGSGNALTKGMDYRPFDRLACISSPLDLAASATRMDAWRNRLYRKWILRRLSAQTLRDPFGIADHERKILSGSRRPGTIRQFDEAITAPRWGFRSAADYYRQASPLPGMTRALLPPTLLLHALDDPWVPPEPTVQLAGLGDPDLQVVICRTGGHNGFHGRLFHHGGSGGSSTESALHRNGCWSDHLVSRWLQVHPKSC